MRRARRQVEDFAGADWQVATLPAILHAQHHLAFELMEELRAFVPVIVAARVRAAHDHDDEIAIHDALVADRWLQQVAMLVDPALQVEGRCERHGCFLPYDATLAPAQPGWKGSAVYHCGMHPFVESSVLQEHQRCDAVPPLQPSPRSFRSSSLPRSQQPPPRTCRTLRS